MSATFVKWLAGSVIAAWSVTSGEGPKQGDDIYGPNRFTGAAACSAGACHGGIDPGRKEYRVWLERDKHAVAYSALFDRRSLLIAERLRIGPPDKEESCLACHSTTAGRLTSALVDVREGVGCESCHGAAEKWLAPHKRSSWKAMSREAKYLQLGMWETKDVVARAARCVECHVGGPGRDVNHEMLAAGHPPLVFELDLFTSLMPPHWKETPDKSPAFGATAWAVGQAVVLKQSLSLLRSRLAPESWPEFAEFDCAACHHGLEDPSWRQRRGYAGRAPGSTYWLRPQSSLLERLAAPDGDATRRKTHLATIARSVRDTRVSLAELRTLVEQAEESVAGLPRQLASKEWSERRLNQLLTEFTTRTERESLEPAEALHLTLAISAFYEAIQKFDGAQSRVLLERVWLRRAAINRLIDATQDPAGYSPLTFANELDVLRPIFDSETK